MNSSSRLSSLREAIDSEMVPEYRAQQSNGRLKLDFDLNLQLTAEGKRKTVQGITSQDTIARQLSFVNVRFLDCHIPTSEKQFTNCEFENCQLNGDVAEFVESVFLNSKMSVETLKTSQQCQLTKVMFASKEAISLVCSDTTFIACEFASRKIHGRALSRVTLFSCEFVAEQVTDITISKCTINSTWFASNSQFMRCKWTDTQVDRIFIESLGTLRGGLTDPVLSTLRIEDPIADLRLLFSGWMSFVHIVAVTLFASSYLLFVLWKCSQTWLLAGVRFVNQPISPDMEPLGIALLKFVAFGNGSEVLLSWHSFFRTSTFIFFCLFNAARLALWLKARGLEHQHSIIGIWPPFLFEEQVTVLGMQVGPIWLTWMKLQKFVKVGALITLACAAVHFWSIFTFSVLK